jgi:glyoxylase-like metal-dependent hydrolase (beta-lactamase superfamily II)
MKYEIFNVLPEYGTNTIVLWDENSLEAILFDPSAPAQIILDFVNTNKLNVKYIALTHGHADHISGVNFFKDNLKSDILIHPEDAPMLLDGKKNLSAFMGNDVITYGLDKEINDNDIIKVGDIEFRVIHTPGHTRGGVCFYTDGLLISGDTLFQLSIGRTDFPGGSFDSLKASVKEKLFILPEETKVIPGHGAATSIEIEKVENPFLGIASRI